MKIPCIFPCFRYSVPVFCRDHCGFVCKWGNHQCYLQRKATYTHVFLFGGFERVPGEDGLTKRHPLGLLQLSFCLVGCCSKGRAAHPLETFAGVNPLGLSLEGGKSPEHAGVVTFSGTPFSVFERKPRSRPGFGRPRVRA